MAAAIGGAGAAESIKPFLRQTFGFSSSVAAVLAIAVVVVPLTLFTIMFGELMPKVFSLRNKEWVCLRLSPVMRWFCFSVWPAVWLFEGAVMALMTWSERRWRPRMDSSTKREAIELLELRAHAAYARASRVIGEQEERIILGAARLSSRTVREIMLPAEHISMLDVNASLGESLVTAHLDMHTRFPVAERPGDPQSILGYVNFKDLVALMRLSPHDASLRAILRPMPSLSADLLLTACLERLIREHTHIAVVCDAAGKVVGLITLEDILEELVGDIQDEYDRLPVHAVPSGRAWVVGGGVSLGAAEGADRHRSGGRSARPGARGRRAERERLDCRPLAGAAAGRRDHRPRRPPRGGAEDSPPESARSPGRPRRRGRDGVTAE